MSRTSPLPKRLQPMLATLTDAPFDDPGWVFEDKYDGFRMIAEIRRARRDRKGRRLAFPAASKRAAP
jgi:bifunctional non-homologous end joining protein LigD